MLAVHSVNFGGFVFTNSPNIHFWSIDIGWDTFFLSFFFVFLELHIGKFLGEALNQSYSCRLIPQPRQGGMQAASATCTTAHENAASFNPLSDARDWTHILMDTSRIHFPAPQQELPLFFFFSFFFWGWDTFYFQGIGDLIWYLAVWKSMDKWVST